MCFHQPAPNDGEDGRLLLLLLSALHFINLKSCLLFLLLLLLRLLLLCPQEITPEGSGQLVNCWEF